MEDYISLPEEAVKKEINLSFDKKSSLIPFTIGTLSRPYDQVKFIKNKFT